MNKNLLLIGLAVGLISCSSEESTGETVEDVLDVVDDAMNDDPIDDFADFEFHMTIANMPSPVEYLSILDQHQHLYNADLVVPVEKADTYVTSSQQAIGFGMYLTDLAYMSETEHTESLTAYFNAAHKLADGLGAAASLEAVVQEHLDAHAHNSDSVHSFVHRGYEELEGYLTTETRLVTATELLVGGWIEAQYIITHIALTAPDEDIRSFLLTDINEQKLHLNNMVDLMNAINDDALSSHLAQFEELKTLYHSFADESELTDELIGELNQKLMSLRASMI